MICLLSSYNFQSLGVRFPVTPSMQRKTAANLHPSLSSLNKKPVSLTVSQYLNPDSRPVYSPQFTSHFRSHLSSYFSSLSTSCPSHLHTYRNTYELVYALKLWPHFLFAWNVLVLSLIMFCFYSIAYISMYFCALFDVFTLWTTCLLKVFYK